MLDKALGQIGNFKGFRLGFRRFVAWTSQARAAMGRPSSVRKKQPSNEGKGLPADMEDPVDKFHAPRDKLMLNPSDDERDDDGLDNEPIYDLQDIEDESDEEESEEDMDEGQNEEEQGQLGRCKYCMHPDCDHGLSFAMHACIPTQLH